MSGECTVTPGDQFAIGDAHTTSRTNLLGVPQVSVSAKAITDNEIADAGISKHASGSVTVDDLSAAVQSKFGYKNFCYNPGFWHWSAGTSFTSGTTNADGWVHSMPAISYTISRQTTIAGENDTLLRQSKYYWRCATTTTSASAASFYSGQIKNPRLFSGQQVTVSAVMKVSSGTLPTLSFFVEQNFGTGGSPSADVRTTVAANAQPNASWAKVYATITVPTVNGKTFGSTTDGELRIGYSTANCSTAFQLDVANIQVELGDAATTFEDIDAQKTAGVASIVTVEANGSQKISSAGSCLGVDSRGAYWKPNIVQAYKQDTFSTTSSSYTAITPGLSAAITPSNSSSLVRVSVTINYSTSTGGNERAFFQLKRGSTEIFLGSASGTRETCSAVGIETSRGDDIKTISFVFMDTPSTTSSTTYTIDCRITTGTLYINRTRDNTDNNTYALTASSIIAEEIPV